jgi:hypothetical protein
LPLTFARHWLLREILLLAILTVVLYGGIYFNLMQFWITDLETSILGQYPVL